MNIEVQSIHFTADKKLVDFVNEKVDKLTQYFDGIISCEVFLKLDNSDTQENKISDIKINTPGKILFANGQSTTFEEATDIAVEALRRQLKKHKEKTRGV